MILSSTLFSCQGENEGKSHGNLRQRKLREGIFSEATKPASETELAKAIKEKENDRTNGNAAMGAKESEAYNAEALEAETQARIAADTDLQESMSSVETAGATMDKDLESKIQAEAETRNVTDADLARADTAEVKAREEADAALAQAGANEAAARDQAVAAETAARNATDASLAEADAALQANISAVQAAGAAMDDQLQTKIQAEAKTRGATDEEEAEARAAADTALEHALQIMNDVGSEALTSSIQYIMVKLNGIFSLLSNENDLCSAKSLTCSACQIGADIAGESRMDIAGKVSLSSDGNIVAIGAVQNGDNGINSGHVRVYGWDGISWNQLGDDIDGEVKGDKSGIVSLASGGASARVAIGAHQNDGNGTNSGHIRVYEWDLNRWNQLGGDIDGEAAYDYSGRSVSLSSDGSIVAIGAYYNDGNGDASGHVRVYGWDGSSWSQVGKDIDGEAAEDHSGDSVSLSSNGPSAHLAMMAPMEEVLGQDMSVCMNTPKLTAGSS